MSFIIHSPAGIGECGSFSSVLIAAVKVTPKKSIKWNFDIFSALQQNFTFGAQVDWNHGLKVKMQPAHIKYNRNKQ